MSDKHAIEETIQSFFTTDELSTL